MALFQKTNSVTPNKASSKKAISARKTGEKKPSVLAHRFLLRPRITEKAYSLNAGNQFVFVVAKDAHKSVIRRAVEEVYGVEVVDVRTVNLPGKAKMFGRKGIVGSRSATKKAIVTLKKGQTIELLTAGI